jgi:hypothetical protein
MKVLVWVIVGNRKWKLENRKQKSEVHTTFTRVRWNELMPTITDNRMTTPPSQISGELNIQQLNDR